MDQTRREFLRFLGKAAAMAVVPAVLVEELDEILAAPRVWTFGMDPGRRDETKYVAWRRGMTKTEWQLKETIHQAWSKGGEPSTIWASEHLVDAIRGFSGLTTMAEGAPLPSGVDVFAGDFGCITVKRA